MQETLKAAFVPGGERLSRMDYFAAWLTSIALIVLAGILAMIVMALVVAATSSDGGSADGTLYGYVQNVTVLLMFPAWIYTGTILGVRRLHDLGWSGRWMAIYYVDVLGSVTMDAVYGRAVPAVGVLSQTMLAAAGIVCLILLFKPGQKAVNAYGPVPRP